MTVLRWSACSLLLALAFAARLAGLPQQSDAGIPFVFWGAVYVADPLGLSVRAVGRISAAAPTVTRGPNGLLWGRMDPNFLAALDPHTGKTVAAVPLRFRPYDAIVAPDGRAYVSHNALTRDGFTLSIVDLRSRKRVGQITGIMGLRTGMAEAKGHVYLTAMGVGAANRFDHYLYEIDTRGDTLREVRHLPAGGASWRLFTDGRLIYLFTLPPAGSPSAFDVIDPITGETVRTVSNAGLGSDLLPTDLIGTDESDLLFLCRSGAKRNTLAWLSPSLEHVAKTLPLPGSVDEFVGFQDGVVVFLDYGSRAGVNDASLSFFSLREKKEVRRIKISP